MTPLKRLAEMLAIWAKPVANARVETTRTQLAREIVARRRLARRREHLAILIADYRRQDGELSR